jgi:uncharacterized membrane protein YgdD (TMEM256/DUF423 family)
MRTPFLCWAAWSAFAGVAFGAFGAHGLKTVLNGEMLAVYKTAVLYQMWHALGLGLIALLSEKFADDKKLYWAGRLMLSGIVLFSGSLYLLAISNLKYLGLITPLGGLAWLIAWLLVAEFARQNRKISPILPANKA